jgi:UDP-3-O-[3-hydroxymyristoyl] glucosamine N-acyltransferase
MDRSLQEIAKLVGGTLLGDGSIRIAGVNGIKQAGPSDLTFLAHPHYRPFLDSTNAGAILVTPDVSVPGKNLIQVANPYVALTAVLQLVEGETLRHPTGGHPSAVVAQGVKLGSDVALDAHAVICEGSEVGDRTVLYAGVYVGRNCVIGPDTVIYPNVVLREGTRVGARCIIHSGTVIGSDGFGFVFAQGQQMKIPQVGTVVLEDDVEVGANSAVDRAAVGTTTVGQGTKIDNLVQIGHNVQIGKHCVISGQTGIAGSAMIGNYVALGARAGIAGHIEIGDGVMVGALAGVTKSHPAKKIISGFPAKDHDEEKRVQAALRNLPALLRRVRELEKRVEELEGPLNGTTEDDR